MESRQRRWQRRMRFDGKCEKCGHSNDTEGSYCSGCKEKDKTQSRNRYRVMHGIPLDLPIILGRPHRRVGV